MATKKVIIPNSWYKLYRSKLQINQKEFDKNNSTPFNDKSTEYIFKMPKTSSNISIIHAQDYFYDSFKIKGDLGIDCSTCNLNFKIHPLKKSDNKYEWNAAKFDYLNTKKLNIYNADNLWVEISPIIYHIGLVPNYSPIDLKEINLQGNYINTIIDKVENLEKITIKLPDQTDKDNVKNFQHFEIKNCPKLKIIDFSQIGKNNFIDLYIGNKTNQDVILKFKKAQIFPPHTLATLLHMNNGFTKAYLNKYTIPDLLDIKNPQDIIEVKYSDLIKKVQKKYPQIVDEVIKGEIVSPAR